MARYLHYYNTQQEFNQAYRGRQYNEPWTSYVGDSGMTVNFDKNQPNKYEVPLTFDMMEDGIIYICYDGEDDSYAREIAYSINGGELVWAQPTMDESVEIEVEKYDVVQFFGDNDSIAGVDESSNFYYTYFSCEAKFNVRGNIMSLLDSADFRETENFPNNDGYVFSYLFNECGGLLDAHNLLLPITTLTSHCYECMFIGCHRLARAPELPATSLYDYCYYGMFSGCSGLRVAPELPATDISEYCYANMFYHCSSLRTAPELPATELQTYCYGDMFYGCSNLLVAPELPATSLASNCYRFMFCDCTSLFAAPSLPATELQTYCYGDMFRRCSNLTMVPELPATTLVNNCYGNMFNGCWNLIYIKAMFTTTPSTTYTNNWVNGVSQTGTFVKNGAAQWDVRGNHGIPNNWTVEIA